MKIFSSKKLLLLGSVLLFINVHSFSQPWILNSCNNVNTTFTDNSTDNISLVGIGDFKLNNDCPEAALDICIPYLFDKGNYAGGDAIYTSADSKYDHIWRMYTYDPSSNPPHPGIGKFQLMNFSASNDVQLNVIQDGALEFFTSNTHWARLTHNGNYGLSNTWTDPPSNYTPQSLLHLNQFGNNDVWSQWTNGNTLWDSPNRGLSIGLDFSPGFVNSFTNDRSVAKFIQHSIAPMKFYTGGVVGGATVDFDRMIINSDYNTFVNNTTVNTSGFVGIGNNHYWDEEHGSTGPLSLLHLQGPSNYSPFWVEGSWRTWNRTGIYLSENTDQMYIGLKDENGIDGVTTNRSDAVIAWGDDQIPGDNLTDFFRLIFVSGANSGNGNNTAPRDAGSRDGRETMRMTPWGNMGVGPLFTSHIAPAKRLELLDAQNLTTFVSLDQAQLRLTFTQAATANINTTGIWTDLQTTANGDLFIHPFSGANDRRVGINIHDPGNTLEINSNAVTSTPGASGLRFHDLTTASSVVTPSPWPANNRSVLTVDANGDVILVRDEGTGIGDVIACGTPINNYVTKWIDPTLKTICNTQIYDDYTNVGIGWPVTFNNAPLRKLDVNGDINLRTNAAGNRYSIYFNNERFLATDGASNNSAVYVGVSAGPSSPTSSLGNVAVGYYSGNALTSGSINTLLGTNAGSGLTSGSGNVFVGYKAGLPYTAHGNNTALGNLAGGNTTHVGTNNVFLGANANLTYNDCDYSAVIGAEAGCEESNTIVLGRPNYIDHSTSLPTHVLIGYTGVGGLADQDARLYVNDGDATTHHCAYFQGSIFHNGSWTTSDRSLKSNIENFSASNILNKLSPKVYDFDLKNNPQMGLPSGKQFGLIAQDLEQVLPNLVSEWTTPQARDSEGKIVRAPKTIKAVNYTEIIPILVQGFKEQQERINQLEQELQSCCASSQLRKASPSIDVELSNSIILNQNDPNPFAEETRITFNIPESVIEAKIIFTDNRNNIIQTVKINERGAGQLNVYSSKLSSGIYTYTLVADGKVIDSKKMVCSK